MKLKKIFYLILATVLIYLVLLTPEALAATKVTYDGTIDEAKYPGYKRLLDNIKTQYGYNIELYYTGVDWNQALMIQYQGPGKTSPKSLFYESDTRLGMWYCPLCGNTNYDTGIPCASLEAIAYMLDPRNSINDESIYQFMNFEGNNLTKEQITTLVQGTYLNDQVVIDALHEAATTHNLNAAFLIAKIIIEQGDQGSVLSKGEGYNGQYAGVYNFFNFYATGNTKEEVIINGLKFAHDSGWKDKRTSIMEGARLIKENYLIGRGQCSFYFMKYNYAGKESFGSWQYEQNIMGAESKGRTLRSYYKKMTNMAVPTMVIPVYENMPTTLSQRPDTTKVNSMTYEEGTVTNAPSSMKVRAAGSTSGILISSAKNNTDIKIIKRAEQKNGDYFWDLICTSTGTYGYAAREVGGDLCLTGKGVWQTANGRNKTTILPIDKQVVAKEDGNIHLTPNITVEDIKKVYPTAIVKASNGTELTTGNVGTNAKVEMDGKSINVVKKGDVNGDGKVSLLDAGKVFNHCMNKETINDGIILNACDANSDGKVSLLDAGKIFNSAMEKGNITIQ